MLFHDHDIFHMSLIAPKIQHDVFVDTTQEQQTPLRCDRLRVQLAIQKVATLANDKSRNDVKEVPTHLEIPPALEGVYDPLQYRAILWPRWPVPSPAKGFAYALGSSRHSIPEHPPRLDERQAHKTSVGRWFSRRPVSSMMMMTTMDQGMDHEGIDGCR
jgi:hypothetical protein